MGHLRRLNVDRTGSRMARTALVCLSLVALGGCGKKRSLEVPPQPRAALDAGKPSDDQLYTATGQLKPGGGMVDWLEIPRAFEHTKQDYEQHRVFEARGVTLERVRAFFAERMLTGKVEERPNSVFYPGVMPAGGGAKAVRLNVRITQRLNGMTELDIERLAVDNVPPLPFEEAKRAAAAAAKRAQ